MAAPPDCAPTVTGLGQPVGAPALEADAFVAADGTRLPLRDWRPEGEARAVVLALHGFGDYANAFRIPGEAWARMGIRSYAYDQRGFGRSPTRGRWFGVELSAQSRRALYVPDGFAHGFQTLTDETEVFYQMSTAYRPGFDAGVHHADPALGIAWPLPVTVVSDRDRGLPPFAP